MSHSLWGVALFRSRVRWWAAAAFGALPDIIAFLPARIQELVEGNPNLSHEPRPLSAYPAITMPLYDFSHSLFGLAIVGAATWLILGAAPSWARRRDASPQSASRGVVTLFCIGPWALHLAVDAPLHTADFFPTPLFWPFSDMVVSGIAWAQPAVWLPNLALLAVALWYTWPRAKVSLAGSEDRPGHAEEGTEGD